MGTPSYFPAICTKGNNFCEFLFATLGHFKKRSLLKERIFLLQEQILPFTSLLILGR